MAKAGPRPRASELSDRIGQAVAVICRLCGDIQSAGRATASLYSQRRGPEAAGELERADRRGREFDARLARGLYQVRDTRVGTYP